METSSHHLTSRPWIPGIAPDAFCCIKASSTLPLCRERKGGREGEWKGKRKKDKKNGVTNKEGEKVGEKKGKKRKKHRRKFVSGVVSKFAVKGLVVPLIFF